MPDESRIVSTTLNDILSLVSCAKGYGFARDIFFHGMAGITGHVTDEEIRQFGKRAFLTEEARTKGYSREDYKRSGETLREWRDQYAPAPQKDPAP